MNAVATTVKLDCNCWIGVTKAINADDTGVIVPDIVDKLVLKLSNDVVTVGTLAAIVLNEVDICAKATVIAIILGAD